MLGMEPERAALANGVTAAEYARWIEIGMRGEEQTGSVELVALDSEEHQCVLFIRALEQAEARAELDALRAIRDPAVDSLPYRWFLERRFADQWAKTPATVRAAQMQGTAPDSGEATPDNVDEVDEVTRKREEKARGAGGKGH